jgi:hypothetical protein
MNRLIRQLAKEGHFGDWQMRSDSDNDAPLDPPSINPETWPGDGLAIKFVSKVRFPQKTSKDYRNSMAGT